MANPYAMTPLYHSPGVQSYCGPSDNLSLAGHYTDMRSSAGWYGSTANDPRFASEYCQLPRSISEIKKKRINATKWLKQNLMEIQNENDRNQNGPSSFGIHLFRKCQYQIRCIMCSKCKVSDEVKCVKFSK